MKYFQISESDLAELESTLPAILDRSYLHLNNADRAAWRRVQEIVKNVRWNYGPPLEVEKVE